MDENGTIEDIDSLEALKLAIEAEPENIYLIDHDKIIDEKAINSKIKFLKPKDGIEKKFLDDHGIEDVSVNSIEELPKYVIKKLESMHLTDIFDELDEEDEESKQTQEDLSVSQNEIEEINNILDDIENQDEQDEESDDFDLDDDLKGLLSHDEDEIDEPQENFEVKDEDKEEEVIDDMHSLMDMDIQAPQEIIEEIPPIDTIPQGERNMDDLTQLDQLQEDDLKAALDGLDIAEFSTPVKPAAVAQPSPSVSNVATNDSIQINSSNVADLQALIMQLLNNKTLEITVKIKE